MIDWGKGKARGRVGTWPEGRAAAPPHWPGVGELPAAISEYVKRAAAIDFGPGRLIPWVPVAFGLGVAIYFSAEHEPSALAAALLVLAGLVLVYLARIRPVAFPLTVIATAIAAGFAVITLKTAWI